MPNKYGFKKLKSTKNESVDYPASEQLNSSIASNIWYHPEKKIMVRLMKTPGKRGVAWNAEAFQVKTDNYLRTENGEPDNIEFENLKGYGPVYRDDAYDYCQSLMEQYGDEDE